MIDINIVIIHATFYCEVQFAVLSIPCISLNIPSVELQTSDYRFIFKMLCKQPHSHFNLSKHCFICETEQKIDIAYFTVKKKKQNCEAFHVM